MCSLSFEGLWERSVSRLIGISRATIPEVRPRPDRP
jgi:hypothetical protein